MSLKPWSDLPAWMQCDAVRQYYDVLNAHRVSLFWKRLTDVVLAALLLIVLSPLFLLLALWVACDSRGPIFFRQERVTAYGKIFRMLKFRSMVVGAEGLGTSVTLAEDGRITRAGKILRRFRLDELPQLWNVLTGDMSFVGTRPEVEKYVRCYTEEMRATLLLPAGITSQASIRYRDEDRLLQSAQDAEAIYIERILPQKMQFNLRDLAHFSLRGELKTMVQTVLAVLGLLREEEKEPV